MSRSRPSAGRGRLGRVFRRVVAEASDRATNGPPAARRLLVAGLEAIDDRRRLHDGTNHFTLRTSSWTEAYRADTFWSKEPETIAWLRSTFKSDSVLYDVGANVGVFTIFALQVGGTGSRAVCFEPSGLNFGRLCLNLNDNKLDRQALALPVALGAQRAVAELALSSLDPGAALHGESYVSVQDAVLRQGMVVLPLDEVRTMADLPAPTHLKVDVDGPELQVLAGARATLAEPSLRHVLVEVPLREAALADAALAAAGLDLDSLGPLDGDIQNRIYRRP
jgi:FkbM family methyltransferase